MMVVLVVMRMRVGVHGAQLQVRLAVFGAFYPLGGLIQKLEGILLLRLLLLLRRLLLLLLLLLVVVRVIPKTIITVDGLWGTG